MFLRPHKTTIISTWTWSALHSTTDRPVSLSPFLCRLELLMSMVRLLAYSLKKCSLFPCMHGHTCGFLKHPIVCITHVWMRTCVCVCLWATAALFINTSVGLTVHSGRWREPWDSLGQRPHKKSLLIYFPPNWKVHAHTWLNHQASTGDGPPLHTGETRSQFCRAGPSQAWQRKHTVTLHTYTLLNGFCRCAAPDIPSKAWSPLLPTPHCSLLPVCTQPGPC